MGYELVLYEPVNPIASLGSPLLWSRGEGRHNEPLPWSKERGRWWKEMCGKTKLLGRRVEILIFGTMPVRLSEIPQSDLSELRAMERRGDPWINMWHQRSSHTPTSALQPQYPILGTSTSAPQPHTPASASQPKHPNLSTPTSVPQPHTPTSAS